MNVPAAKDHPGVIAFPPLIWLINAGLSIAAHFLFHFRMMAGRPSLIAGILLLLAALALLLWAARTMKLVGTNVDPREPTLIIVRAGPYRFTRNPMYLGLALLQLAVGFLCNDWLTLLFAIPLVLVLHFGVILREERYLEAKFGPPYLDLKRNVRRWL